MPENTSINNTSDGKKESLVCEQELLTTQQLKSIMPNLSNDRISIYISPLNLALEEFSINTPLRLSAFLAQIAHESGELRYFEEFASGKEYDGRKDLGNINSGDGPLFKGRAPLQITGRTNYELVGKALGIDLIKEPILLTSPTYGFRASAYFWKVLACQRLSKAAKNYGVPINGDLNDLADKKDFIGITFAINGGQNGIEERQRYYNNAKKILNVT
jgi:predicted chitinase